MSKRHRKRHRRFQRQTSPGSAPGRIVVDPSAERPEVTATVYSPEGVRRWEVKDVDEVASLRGPDKVLWLDVAGLGDGETIRKIGRVFGLHPLALEDVVHVHQQAKVEDYGSHLFVVTRMPDDLESARTEQMSIFLGTDFVLTFQEKPGDCLAPVRMRLQEPNSLLRQRRADFLAYAIIDAVIDAYFPVLENCGQRLDELEDLISDNPPKLLTTRIHELRATLRELRRAVWPFREMLNSLLRDRGSLVSDETRTYLRDCYDHTVQCIDLLEIFRESCSDLRDAYLSSVSNRMNEIMMVLTIIATIFIPLGFIAGVYGMNFHPEDSPWNMPETTWQYGYPFALCLMAVVGLGMLGYFYRHGWIWQRRQGNGEE